VREQAEAAVARATEVARAQGARVWKLRAAMTLCDLRANEGDLEEARGMLARLVSSFVLSLDMPDLVEARRRLE
jgi:hypothetical protein